MGDFSSKFKAVNIAQAHLNVSETLNLKKQLQCKPYVYYLHRFRKIYRDAAVIPPKIFRIRATDHGACLRRLGPQYGLSSSCEDAEWFHLANLMPSGFPSDNDFKPAAPKKLLSKPVVCGQHRAANCVGCDQGHGGSWCNGECTYVFGQCIDKASVAGPPKQKCCSGIREYGTMFCLDALKDSGPIAYQCDTMGNNLNQQYFFQSTGLIRHSSGFCLGATSGTQLTKVNCSSPLATKWEQVGGYEPEEFRWYENEVKQHGLTEDLPDH
jgi:hypothetical protein